jgi:hypothetical protein
MLVTKYVSLLVECGRNPTKGCSADWIIIIMLGVFCGLWIGHILRRNCLLKHVTERKIEGRIRMTGRRGSRHNVSLDDLKEKVGYWKLKEEAQDRTVWRTNFGRGYGPVVRLQIELMKFRLLAVAYWWLLFRNSSQYKTIIFDFNVEFGCFFS